MALSCVAAALIAYKLYRGWDFRVSSVRCLFLTFFVYLTTLMLAKGQFVDTVNTPLLTHRTGQTRHLHHSGHRSLVRYGHFEASPVYLRLIMMVYATMAFQFEVTSIYVYATDVIRDGVMLRYIGVSPVIYNATGLALALCTDCSLPCVLHATRWILPRDVESELVLAMDTSPPALSVVSGVESPLCRTRYLSSPTSNRRVLSELRETVE